MVLLICMIFMIFRRNEPRDRAHLLLLFFFGSYLLGDLYWQACIFYYGETPQVSVVSDLSWYASYMFLYLYLRLECEKTGRIWLPRFMDQNRATGGSFRDGGDDVLKRLLPWTAFIFTIAMALFYMRYGEILSNIIYALIMGTMLHAVIYILVHMKNESRKNLKALCMLTTLLCLGEYGAWTASCYFYENSITNPYYWFNILVTVCFPFYIVICTKIRSDRDSFRDSRNEISKASPSGREILIGGKERI